MKNPFRRRPNLEEDGYEDHGGYIQLRSSPGRPPTPESLKDPKPKEPIMEFSSDLSGANVPPYIDGELYCVTWQMHHESPKLPVQTVKTFVLAHDIATAVERAKADILLSIQYETQRVAFTTVVSVDYLGTSVHLAGDVAAEILNGIFANTARDK